MSENPGRFNAKPAALPMFATLPLPDPDKPVLIAGPTASGKSALALWLAEAQGRSVVNADALQVHDSWRVLSARPSPEDEARAPHRLYGHVPRGADYSVGHWLRDVAPLLAENPVIVGGTGLYFSALTEGLADIPPTPPAIRAEADAILAERGIGALLADLDPETAARLDRRNPARVQRAWEVLRATGRGLAGWQAQTGAPLLPLGAVTPWVLMPEKTWLNDRIARRFDQMLREGALDEAPALAMTISGASMKSNIAPTEVSSVTSASTAWISAWVAATLSSVAAVRPAIQTLAPSRAKLVARSAPRPVPPPVIRTVLPRTLTP